MKYPRPRGWKDGEHSVICQYTGFRVLSSEVVRDYNGVLTRRRSEDKRHPQETPAQTGYETTPTHTNPRRTQFVDVTWIEDPEQ